ncbi:MAG: peptide chain release factor N(5)-glutamine methyltransferase [Deltaproteobacteria bacterium]|nr:MAG: peptide chain release factor N(5)-glutamine methyltransferase [Deltaproteobacteria bacterium]
MHRQSFWCTVMVEQPRYTPVELIRLTAEYFKTKNVDAPRLEAEVLLAHLLEVDRLRLYLDFDKPLTQDEVAGYRVLVRRRASGEPTAYICAKREFWSLEFEVCPGVLIPRPETEVLVERALEVMGETGEFLEVGVGSGAISTALMKERGGWRGAGVEISAEAEIVAARNIAKHGLGGRYELFSGNLYGPVVGRVFNVIVSNPPYIPSGEIEGLEREVSEHEPRLALDGGEDGLEIIRRLAEGAAPHLEKGGHIMVEFGAGQGGAVKRIFEETNKFDQVELLRDYSGRDRILRARQS